MYKALCCIDRNIFNIIENIKKRHSHMDIDKLFSTSITATIYFFEFLIIKEDNFINLSKQ